MRTVECQTCSRTFEVDERRLKGFTAARCVCGTRIMLLAEAGKPAAPRRLGSYLLVHRIAVGGMGEIYYGKLAGLEGFEREVAIKRMLPHLSKDKSFIDMMVKEAKLTVQLHHPNIVQVYDLAKDGDDYFIAMEYVPGIPVSKMLEAANRRDELLPTELAVHIASQVLRGLAYAHALTSPTGKPMMVLHRDVTPQNILITRNAWVKITDFGIAKARNEISTTGPGVIRGTLGYIAPEQLRGIAADQRVDVFCAAIVLWETLAARPLFRGTDEVDTFRMIAEGRIPPMSQFRDDVSAELEAVLHKGLARNREDRFATAVQFDVALSEVMFPHTSDDYVAVARRHLQERPYYFESLESVSEHLDDGVTKVDLSAQASEPPIIDVTELTVRRRAPVPRRVVWLAAAVAMLALGGSGVAASGLLDGLLGSLAPVPEPLTQAEVQRAVDVEGERLIECYRKGTSAFLQVGTLLARLSIPPTGVVSSVKIDAPSSRRAPLCVEQILRGLQLRRHALEPAFERVVTLPSPTSARRSDRCAKRLTPPELRATIDRYLTRISACTDDLRETPDAPKETMATLTIDKRGAVTAVAFDPELPAAAVDDCLRREITRMRFRCHPVPELAFKFKLEFVH